MTVLAAVLAFTVSLLYAIIALDVVPRLARLAAGPSPLLTAARWGAFAFFSGCALTHVQIGIQILQDTGPGGTDMGGGLSAHMALAHVLPHLAQVFGGLTFILIAQRRLDIRLATKDVAEQLAVLEQRFRAASSARRSASPWSRRTDLPCGSCRSTRRCARCSATTSPACWRSAPTT